MAFEAAASVEEIPHVGSEGDGKPRDRGGDHDEKYVHPQRNRTAARLH
jgi:hypothetical protein